MGAPGQMLRFHLSDVFAQRIFSVPDGVITWVGPPPFPVGVGSRSTASGGRGAPEAGLLSNVPGPEGWVLIASGLVDAVEVGSTDFDGQIAILPATIKKMTIP